MPVAELIFLTRLLNRSVKYRLPALSSANAIRVSSCALVAGPPSPEKRRVPVPANFVMIPAESTFRIVESN